MNIIAKTDDGRITPIVHVHQDWSDSDGDNIDKTKKDAKRVPGVCCGRPPKTYRQHKKQQQLNMEDTWAMVTPEEEEVKVKSFFKSIFRIGASSRARDARAGTLKRDQITKESKMQLAVKTNKERKDEARLAAIDKEVMADDMLDIHLEDKWDLVMYLDRKLSIIKGWWWDARLSQDKRAEAGVRESYAEQQEERRAILLEEEYSTWVDDFPFNVTMATIVLASILYLGVQTDYSPMGVSPYQRPMWYLMECCFFVCFFLEFSLRFYQHGFRYFDENAADFAVTFFMLLDLLFFSFYYPEIPLEIVLFARIHRLTYFVEVLKFFPGLYRGLNSFLGYSSDPQIIKGVLWSCLLCYFVTYLFAVVLTSMMQDLELEWLLYEKNTGYHAREYWGKTWLSFSSLATVMTVDSGLFRQLIRPMLEMDTNGSVVVFAYFFITALCLLNVLIGVIVAGACAKTDTNRAHQAELEARKRWLNITKIGRIFEAIDEDQTGDLTREEMANAFEDPLIRKIFLEVEIPVEDAAELFEILDMDGSGLLDMDEFLGACLRIKGEAKAKDTHVVKLATQGINDKLIDIQKACLDIHRTFMGIENLVGRLERKQSENDKKGQVLLPGKPEMRFEKATFSVPSYDIDPDPTVNPADRRPKLHQM